VHLLAVAKYSPSIFETRTFPASLKSNSFIERSLGKSLGDATLTDSTPILAADREKRAEVGSNTWGFLRQVRSKGTFRSINQQMSSLKKAEQSKGKKQITDSPQIKPNAIIVIEPQPMGNGPNRL
jgi:hypothetical protein